jgi:hypothetical protein
MANIKRFVQYIKDERSTNRLLYSLITALAVDKPDMFDFLNDNKNRYLLQDRSFWQSVVFSLKDSKSVKCSKDCLLCIKGISVENDWLYLKQCVKAAETIKKTFYNIQEIEVEHDQLIIKTATDSYVLRDKDIEHNIQDHDIEKLLGFNLYDVYNNGNWKTLVTEFIQLLKDELKPDYLDCLKFFTDKLFEDEVELDWDVYCEYRVKGLGVKCESLPKLYYNSLYNFCVDVVNYEDAFRDYKFFIDKWLNTKDKILNRQILIPLIKQNKEKRKSFKNIIQKKFSLSNDEYCRFDNKLNINKIPSKTSIKYGKTKILGEKIWINSKKSLILELKSDIISIKIFMCLCELSLSRLEIKDRYEEI